jgi:hypothetical protein
VKTQRTYEFKRCICQHPNLSHSSNMGCRVDGCLCANFIRDYWLTRIVFRRQVAMFIRDNAP